MPSPYSYGPIPAAEPKAPLRQFGHSLLQKAKEQHGGGNEHALGFNFWHYIDVVNDGVCALVKRGVQHAETATTKLATKIVPYVPAAKMAVKRLPFLGVATEAIHVKSQFQNALDDVRADKISGAKFSGLCLFYGGYVASGYFGFLSTIFKEAIMQDVHRHGLISPRYAPHTLEQEWKHMQQPSYAHEPAGKADLGSLAPLVVLGKKYNYIQHKQ